MFLKKGSHTKKFKGESSEKPRFIFFYTTMYVLYGLCYIRFC